MPHKVPYTSLYQRLLNYVFRAIKINRIEQEMQVVLMFSQLSREQIPFKYGRWQSRVLLWSLTPKPNFVYLTPTTSQTQAKPRRNQTL